MPLSVPTYTSKVRGAIVRQFECEACSAEYFYRQVAEGQSQDYVGIAPLSNTEAAEKEAQSKLDDQLSELDKAVPCPTCGCIQSYMIDTARMNHLGWLEFAGAALAFLGAVIGFIFVIPSCLFLASEAFFLNDYRFLKPVIFVAIVAVILWFSGCMILKVRKKFSDVCSSPKLVDSESPYVMMI